jgi:hypothetical protein
MKLRKVESHSSSSDGSFESILGSDGSATTSSEEEEATSTSEGGPGSGDSMKSEPIASRTDRWEQPPV